MLKFSRPIPSGGKAFIEFMDATQATTAKDALQGFKVTPERPIKLTFAKNWWLIINTTSIYNLFKAPIFLNAKIIALVFVKEIRLLLRYQIEIFLSIFAWPLRSGKIVWKVFKNGLLYWLEIRKCVSWLIG